MSSAIEDVKTAVVEFDKVAAGLQALKTQYAGLVYEVRTTKGMEEAKAARAAIREPRYEIERVRKAAKAPILALGKELDSRAKTITDEILAIEAPIDEQIKAEEARKDREKQEKIEAEQRRVQSLQERVAELRGNQSLSVLDGSALIAEHIGDLRNIPVDESFDEYRQHAEDAKAAGIARLEALHTAALEHEAEQARIRTEREELAKLRAEAEKRGAEDRARLAEEERQAKIARDAEAVRAAAELAAQRERIAAEEAAAKAARDEEARKLAAERAEFERQQAEARRQREEADRAERERARIAAMKKPPDEELIRVLCDHYHAPESKVIGWLLAVDFSARKSA